MKKGRKVNLTQDEITAWAEQLSGSTVTKIAERRGISRATAYNWIENAKNQIGTIDVEEMRGCLFSLFPDAINAIKHCLTVNKDGQIALRLLNGLAVLTDKREIEYNDKSATPAELKQRITNLVAGQDQGTDEADERVAS